MFTFDGFLRLRVLLIARLHAQVAEHLKTVKPVSKLHMWLARAKANVLIIRGQLQKIWRGGGSKSPKSAEAGPKMLFLYCFKSENLP